MSSLRMFAACTLYGGRYFDFYQNICLSCGTLDVIDNCLGCLAGAHAKGDRSIDAPATRFGVIPCSLPRGAPSMNNESIIWWKLLPSRQKHEISTSKSSKIGSHIKFK